MVRDAIADPAVSLDCAAVAGAAGDEPLNSLGILSDERYCAGLCPDQDPRFNALISGSLVLMIVLVIKTCLKPLLVSLSCGPEALNHPRAHCAISQPRCLWHVGLRSHCASDRATRLGSTS